MDTRIITGKPMSIQTRGLAVFIWLALGLQGPAWAHVNESTVIQGPADPAGPERHAAIVHHRLEVTLLPDRHELVARDHMTVRAMVGGEDELSFSLHGQLQVELILEERAGRSHALPFRAEPAPAPHGAHQAITVRFPQPLSQGETVTLLWQYRGEINDPPREPQQLRFVTPSETSGYIGLEGVYLGSETLWYPELPGSLPTYAVRITTPADWTAVTQGRQLERKLEGSVAVADWEVRDPTEALTLVANRFVTTRRQWQGIEVATYLFPEDAQLANVYLDATVRYLELYTALLGPYPFPQFAVVENFFASGLGLPSFTLLGSEVVKRRYTQPYALGHEIVHSWFGNAVLNAVGEGNWVEGLTTYLANYYYEELTSSPEAARAQRRLMLLGYAVYVSPDEDYPIARFRQKTDQRDNAIGYQKAAMVFHMLRREIGDDAFWRGLRTLATRFRGRYVGWEDLERVFSEAAGQALRWFFVQWVERPGAPTFSVAYARDRVRLSQGLQAYRLRLPIVVRWADGREERWHVEVTETEQEVPLPPGARLLHLDPDYEVFRRLPRNELPPMLNLVVTDRDRRLVLASGGREADRAPYLELARRVLARDSGFQSIRDQDVERTSGAMLVLGGPGVNQAADWAVRGCGGRVRIEAHAFEVEGRRFEKPGAALLISCRRPDEPEHVVSLFYGVSPEATAKVARLLFFYGWQSYVVFENGAVVARGDLASPGDTAEVQLDAP
jgi:hypothetical protein